MAMSVQAQDILTVRDTDIYMFNQLPLNKDLRVRITGMSCGPLSGGIIVQQYVPQDTVTVYGVALTMKNTCRNGSFDSVRQVYRALLMQRAAGTSDDVNSVFAFRSLQYVDSISLKPENIRQCMFRYEFDSPTEYTLDVPCVEFYFNKPAHINRMTDTFYVGREDFSWPDSTFFPSEFSGLYNLPPVVGQFWYVGYADTTAFIERTRSSPYDWGFAFPIIGFRCKPLDEEEHAVLVIESASGDISVLWYSVEEGATYNVRLTSSDGEVDTLVVTTDSSYTFVGMPSNHIYNVQVRKQCHYATVNYDTIVYSPWVNGNTQVVLGDCPSVTGVQVSLSNGTATVTWNGNPVYTEVKLRHGCINEPQTMWTEVDVTDSTSYTLADLQPSTRYGVTLKAVCGNIGCETGWSVPEYFYISDTGSTDISTIGETALELKPNPASGEVTFSVDGELQSVVIHNALGQPVDGWKYRSLSSHSATLDVSALPAGPYLVRIATAAGTVTRKLVVQRR